MDSVLAVPNGICHDGYDWITLRRSNHLLGQNNCTAYDNEGETMALVKCPDCGKQISDAALSCIECGRPMVPVQQAGAEPSLRQGDLPKLENVTKDKMVTRGISWLPLLLFPFGYTSMFLVSRRDPSIEGTLGSGVPFHALLLCIIPLVSTAIYYVRRGSRSRNVAILLWIAWILLGVVTSLLPTPEP